MIEQILSFLGFTDTVSTLWNLLGYFGMTLVIVAVLSDKWRNQLFVWSPLILLVYAWLYLHDPILMGLQFIITVSGVLNLLNIKKPAPSVIIIQSVIVFMALLITGQISGLWTWFGAFGLWGIALGLTQLPHKRGFVVMALGGLLIIIYAFAFQVWVFFILNIFFFVANLIKLKKKQENKATH